MKKIALMTLILTIVLGSALWFGRFTISKYWYMSRFFKNSPAKIIKATEAEFTQDREILGRYELFYTSSGTKDAGPFLNDKLHWQIGAIAHRGSLVLPDFIHKEMNKDWAIKKPLFKKMGLNFNWMKELLKYDYWNPEENSPAYPEGKKYQTYSFPVPTYKDLITWSKLRYLYGKETGDVQSALKEVRHLMRLIFTNDYLISSMVTVRMLKMENQFEQILTPDEMGDWKFVPEDHIMRAKRHLYSLPSVVDIRVSDETFHKMVKTNVGLCPMLFEGMMSYLALRDLLKDELLYSYQRMGEAIKNTSCRTSILHKMWDDPTWPAFIKQDEDAFALEGKTIMGKRVTWKEVMNNPDLKATIGYILGISGTPSYYQYTAGN